MLPEYVPVAHAVQGAPAVAEYVPLGHGVQLPAPGKELLPSGQAVQVAAAALVEPSGPDEAAAHGEPRHALKSGPVLYVPDGQSSATE